MKNNNKKASLNSQNSDITGDWFFMSPDNINIKEIYDHLKSFTSYSVEIWEDAGVLEIEISDKESIDFESMKPIFKDEAGDSFLKDNNVKSLFMVTFNPEYYDKVVEIFKAILLNSTGFFCADTIDFQPMIK